MKPLATYNYSVNLQSNETRKNRAVDWLAGRLYKLTSRMKTADRLPYFSKNAQKRTTTLNRGIPESEGLEDHSIKYPLMPYEYFKDTGDIPIYMEEWKRRKTET